MQRTISKQLSITYLDSRLNKCDSTNATMQLESYYTMDKPPLTIGLIGPVSRKFTYNINERVNVIPKILVNNSCMLTNVIRTNFLEDYIQNQR